MLRLQFARYLRSNEFLQKSFKLPTAVTLLYEHGGARLAAQKHVRELHSTKLRKGVFDSVRSKLDQVKKTTEDSKEQKAFDAQMKYLCNESRPIDGNVYLETLKDLRQATGLSGFREHLPWVRNNPVLEDLNREELILKSLTDHDRRFPASVSIASKKRLARAVQSDLTEVEGLLERVAVMRCVQKWMLKQKAEDKPLPSSSSELQIMVSAPGSGMKRPRSHQKSFPNPGVKLKKTGRKW